MSHEGVVCRVSFLNVQVEQTLHFQAVKEEVCAEPRNPPWIRGAVPLPFLPARACRDHPQPWGCDVLGGRAPCSIVGPEVGGAWCWALRAVVGSTPGWLAPFSVYASQTPPLWLQERPTRRAGAHFPVPAPAAHVLLVHPLPPAPARVRRPQPADTG